MNGLFLDENRKPLEKLAIDTKLGDNAEAWAQEILDAAHQQLPFLSGFRVGVTFKDKAVEEGYALGTLVVSQPTNLSKKDAEEIGIKKVLIPIIIKNKKLSPFDMFLFKGDTYPLTEQRLKKALLHPPTTDVAADTPKEDSLVSSLMPPERSDNASGSTKSASILMDIAPTVREEDLVVLSSVLTDPFVKRAFDESGTSARLLEFLDKVSDGEEKTASVDERIVPDVVLVEKLQDGYRVKYANRKAFRPVEKKLSSVEADAMMGREFVDAVDEAGVKVACASSPKETMQDVQLVTNHFGGCMTKKASGEDCTGICIPGIEDLVNGKTGLSLFVTDGGFAMQEKIAGKAMPTESVKMSYSEPGGLGFFYKEATGEATVPLEIGDAIQVSDGVEYLGWDQRGPVRLLHTDQPHLSKIACVGERRYVIPSDYSFVGLASEHLQVASDPNEHIVKRAYPDFIAIHYHEDDRYSVRGPAFEKMAEKHKEYVTTGDALWALSCIGVDEGVALQKMAEANIHTSVELRGAFEALIPMEVHEAVAEKRAAARLEALPRIKPTLATAEELIKAAADIPDATTIDNVLSLNFLNAENVENFSKYLPGLESSVTKLAELLMASRLGLQEVPEGSIERAMNHMESVIEGLKEVKQRSDIKNVS